MAVPKKRVSLQRRRIRRGQTTISILASGKCTTCGNITVNYNACSSCGSYKGRKYDRLISVKTEA